MAARADVKKPKYNNQLAQATDFLPHFSGIFRN